MVFIYFQFANRACGNLGIFNSDGQAWHDARARLRPVFYRERISDLECFERHVENLLPLLDTDGQAVEIKDLFLRFTLDVSADFTLGVGLETLKRPLNTFASSFERLRHLKIQRERSKPFKFLVPRSRYQPDLDYIESFMDPIIKETVNEIQADLDAGDSKPRNSRKDAGV
jgi:cytochrome P450